MTELDLARRNAQEIEEWLAAKSSFRGNEWYEFWREMWRHAMKVVERLESAPGTDAVGVGDEARQGAA